jgi:general secretion pathway protein A
MYEKYWRLTGRPFRNTPDTKFFYSSKQHSEALMKMSYGVNERMGGIMLSGDYGCGKTMLARVLAGQIAASNVIVTCGAQPDMTTADLLRTIARGMSHAEVPSTRLELLADALVETIDKSLKENARDGKHTLVIIDEAHMIQSQSVFEVARLLLNFHTENEFLLTLLLIGHPELAARVSDLKQLAQRIPISCTIGHFDKDDTIGYVNARLAVAGGKSSPFTDDAMDFIYRSSGGIPRRINTLCDLSLTLGFAQKIERIDQRVVHEASEKFGVM